MPLLTPADVRGLLAEHGVRPSRALGQNFLADPNTARRIARLAEVGPGDRVLEIGPGVGSLTLALARDRRRRSSPSRSTVTSCPCSKPSLEGAGDVSVVHGDALTVDWDAVLGSGRPGTNLALRLESPVQRGDAGRGPAARGLSPRDASARMVQREVGERLAAGPGSGAYGAVSVKVAYYTTARVVGTVPATVFVPAPKVESALVRLERRAAPPVDVPSTRGAVHDRAGRLRPSPQDAAQRAAPVARRRAPSPC